MCAPTPGGYACGAWLTTSKASWRQSRAGGAPAAAVEAFIARWGTSSGAERANYQIFLAELCDLLGAPRPDPSVADEAANRYVFDKAVTFQNPDGKTSTGYIDLYRRNAFVCETKQSVAREAKDPLSVADPAAPKARRKSGTSVRGTAGWDDSMIAARRGEARPHPLAAARVSSQGRCGRRAAGDRRRG